MQSALLIYSPQTSNRLHYVCELIFGMHLGLAWRITNDGVEYESDSVPGLNYSNDALRGLTIAPAPLLFERLIKAQPIETVAYNLLQVPFVTGGNAFPFDPLAAIFYFVSRYEEYLPFTPNQYEQFKAADSMAFKLGFLDQPVVDRWIVDIKRALAALYPALHFKEHSTKAIFTYDIDVAYAYKGRSALLQLATMGRDVLQLRWNRLRERCSTLLGSTQDPFDTYDFIFKQQEKYQHDYRFFFLLGRNNVYNRNLSPARPLLQALIQRIASKAPIGIHPSYYAHTKRGLLQHEQQLLERITQQKITHCRQHYLRLSFPDTYSNQIESGVTDDYTLGFAEQPGFRAGTAHPFYFFNLRQNQTTPLKLHPVTCMEGSFIEDMQLNAAQTKAAMLQLAERVKQVNGQFLVIWHNHSLSNRNQWSGLQAVHDELAAFFKL